MPRLRIPPRITHPLFRVVFGLVAAWGIWVGWHRFQRTGAAFDPGAVESFLDSRLAALTDSVYRVRVGGLHFDPQRGSARIDSIVITTDAARNGFLVHPFPVLHVVLAEAEVRGVGQDADGGLVIDEVRFSQVKAELTFAPGDSTTQRPGAVVDPTAPILSWTASLPTGVAQILVRRILLEGISATLHPAPGSAGRDQRLEHLRLALDSVRIDPDPAHLRLPILVHDVRVTLADFTGGWDSLSTISVGVLQGSFRDSTLQVRALALRPTRSIAEVVRRSGYRRDRFTVRVDSLAARGVDWRRAVRDGSIPIRQLRVDGADLLIYSDHRLTGRPWTGRPKPILQETIAKFGRPLALDTIEIRRGRIRYQKRSAEGEGIGEVTFTDVSGRLTGLHWGAEAPTDAVGKLVLQARAWGVAPMTLAMWGPMGSAKPQVTMDLYVGPMPLVTINNFASHAGAFDLKGGQLDSLRVRATLVDEHATGEVRPYYHDLSIRARASGGFFSRLGRQAKGVIANSFVIRDDDPDRNGVLTIGKIDAMRDPSKTFWPFAWGFTKAALMPVVTGQGVQEE